MAISSVGPQANNAPTMCLIHQLHDSNLFWHLRVPPVVEASTELFHYYLLYLISLVRRQQEAADTRQQPLRRCSSSPKGQRYRKILGPMAVPQSIAPLDRHQLLIG